MSRIAAFIFLALALAGCVYVGPPGYYSYGSYGEGGYSRTLGPQGDTTGATSD